jgi:hypothetical protein
MDGVPETAFADALAMAEDLRSDPLDAKGLRKLTAMLHQISVRATS